MSEKIYWKGRQWRVTDYGLECVERTYDLDHERLPHRGIGERADKPDLLVHVAEKPWVDVEDLIVAYAVALAVHGYALAFDPDLWRRATDYVRKKKAHSIRHEKHIKDINRERGRGSGLRIIDVKELFENCAEADRRMKTEDAAAP